MKFRSDPESVKWDLIGTYPNPVTGESRGVIDERIALGRWLLSAWCHTMRIRWATWLGLALALAIFGLGRARADDFAVGLSGTPDPAIVIRDVTFQLAVTNLARLTLTNIQIAAVVDGPVNFVSATNAFGSVTNETNTVFFVVDQLLPAGIATLSYTFNPTFFGPIYQGIFVDATNANSLITNFMTQIIIGRAQLEVAFGAIPVGALVGDRLAYPLVVTNLGPLDALDVRLTNTLPTGLTFLGVSPSSQSYIQESNQIVLALGSLAVNTGSMLAVQVQPTLPGNLPLAAAIGAPGYDNPAPTNSQAQATMRVSLPNPAQLNATTASAQVFNRQTGLMEQKIRVTNQGATSVNVVRVVIAGLTNQVVNAAGTNNSNPFVVIPMTLGPDASFDLLLEYFNPTRTPGADPTLSALSVPFPGPVRPPGTVVPITKLLPQSDGTVLLEFPTTLGRQYAILYGPDPGLTNGTALPFVVAPANRIQWIDYGPPLTAPAPDQAATRFYQVIQVTAP